MKRILCFLWYGHDPLIVPSSYYDNVICKRCHQWQYKDWSSKGFLPTMKEKYNG